LQTDYLDILLVHSNGEDQRIIEQENIFSTLETLKRDGKIRLYGMSTKTVAGGLLTIDLADLAMVTLNPTYKDDCAVIAHAHKKQKGILIKKAFASGHLCSSDSSVLDNMQFIFAEPGVTSVIVGTINPDHLRANVAAVSQVLGD
jgi:aryl-alcohol dehydrogenase-like predicted oxidoreductase